jgi:hypothetical protein
MLLLLAQNFKATLQQTLVDKELHGRSAKVMATSGMWAGNSWVKRYVQKEE